MWTKKSRILCVYCLRLSILCSSLKKLSQYAVSLIPFLARVASKPVFVVIFTQSVTSLPKK